MPIFINSNATKAFTIATAASYPLRSLRETAALGGFLRSYLCFVEQREKERDGKALIVNALRTLCINYRGVIANIIKDTKLGLVSGELDTFIENLKTMCAVIRAFPELRGIAINNHLLRGTQSPTEFCFSNGRDILQIYFDGYVYPRYKNAPANPFLRGFMINIDTLESTELKTTVSQTAFDSTLSQQMLSKPWHDTFVLNGAYIIHRVDSPDPNYYKGLVNAISSEDLIAIPGFGAVSRNLQDASVDSSKNFGATFFGIREREINIDIDIRGVKSATLAANSLRLANETYNEIMSRGIKGGAGLTVLAEGYGVAARNNQAANIVCDIGGSRGRNLLSLTNRVKAFGFHKILNQDNLLELMKLLSSYDPELQRLPVINLEKLVTLANDGFRLSFLDSKGGDALLDAAGRMVLGFANSKVQPVTYYAKLPTEIEGGVTKEPDIALALSVKGDTKGLRLASDIDHEEVGEYTEQAEDGGETSLDNDALTPDNNRDRLMFQNALDGVTKEIDRLSNRLGAVNFNHLSDQVITAQRDLDGTITQVVELQGAQAVLNAQAKAILLQVQKVLAYPVISAVYGQSLGLLGSFVTINYDSSSRTFSVKIDKEGMANKLAQNAYMSTRVKYSCGVYPVYRGDVATTNSWGRREILETSSFSVQAVRSGPHKINYMLDTETAKNMNITTDLKSYTLSEERKKSSFFKRTTTVVPHASVQRYSTTEDAFCQQFQAYLSRLLNAEAMKAVGGIRAVIEAAFKAIEAEAAKVAALKAQLAELTTLNDALGVALVQKRLIEFEMSLPTDQQAFDGSIKYSKTSQDKFDLVNSADEATDKTSDSINNKLNRLAFSALSFEISSNHDREELQADRMRILEEISPYILEDDELETVQESDRVEYAGIWYASRIKGFECEVSFTDSTLVIKDESFEIEESFETIREAIAALIKGDTAITLDQSAATEKHVKMERLLEALRFRFNDRIDALMGGIKKTFYSNDNLVSKIQELKSLDTNISSKDQKIYKIVGVSQDGEEANITLNEIPEREMWSFTVTQSAVGFEFEYEASRRGDDIIMRVVRRRALSDERGEPLVPFGCVYYTPRSLVRLLFKMGLTNSTTSAVLAKLYDSYNVITKEQLAEIIAQMELTEREQAVLNSQTEDNKTDGPPTIEYILAGLAYLMLDPSGSGVARLISLETQTIPLLEKLDDEQEDAYKLRNAFNRAALASCLYPNDCMRFD